METSLYLSLMGDTFEKDSKWIYSNSTSTYWVSTAGKMPCQASWGYRNEDGFSNAWYLVKETNTYIHYKHQADNSHIRTWKIKKGLLPAKRIKRGSLTQVGIDLALRGRIELQQMTLGVGGALHLEPRSKEEKCKKLWIFRCGWRGGR